ncbi:MAG: hypothetical protein QXO44_02135 [Thermoplasmatales archaeon]
MKISEVEKFLFSNALPSENVFFLPIKCPESIRVASCIKRKIQEFGTEFTTF